MASAILVTGAIHWPEEEDLAWKTSTPDELVDLLTEVRKNGFVD